MNKSAKILIFGSTGMVGSAICRLLDQMKYENIIKINKEFPFKTVDLAIQASVNFIFETYTPEYVFLCAAKVGGIFANAEFPADFGYVNGMIELNVINAAFKYKVKKLLFLGSSCIYPKNCPQPIKEEYLLTSELESSNEMYALAKIFGLKLCQAYNKQYGTSFISCMPTNLYGPNDNYDLKTSHVFPALIRKIHEAKVNKMPLRVFGDGSVYREFLHVDDLAKACVFLMNNYNDSLPINIGVGYDIKIRDLVTIMSKEIRFDGEVTWDSSKPSGTLRKLLDISKIKALGWEAEITLKDGIALSYENFLMENEKNGTIKNN